MKEQMGEEQIEKFETLAKETFGICRRKSITAILEDGINTEEEFRLICDTRDDLRDRFDELEEERKGITKPINSSLRKVNALFKAPESAAKEIIDEAGKAMKAYMGKVPLTNVVGERRGHPFDVMCIVGSIDKGVYLRNNWKFKVTDITKVPQEYLVESADELMLTALAKRTKGEVKVDGIEFYNDAILVQERRKDEGGKT